MSTAPPPTALNGACDAEGENSSGDYCAPFYTFEIPVGETIDSDSGRSLFDLRDKILPGDTIIWNYSEALPIYVVVYYSDDGKKYFAKGTLSPRQGGYVHMRGVWVFVSTNEVLENSYEDFQPKSKVYEDGAIVNNKQSCVDTGGCSHVINGCDGDFYSENANDDTALRVNCFYNDDHDITKISVIAELKQTSSLAESGDSTTKTVHGRCYTNASAVIALSVTTAIFGAATITLIILFVLLQSRLQKGLTK